VDSDQELFARRIGQVVGGKWTLERLLGSGGMAAVYAARDPGGTVGAVKLLHPEMSIRRDVRERFVREGLVPNQLGHPGAVQILEHGASEQESYLVMELLSGESLGERVNRHGGLAPSELLDYLDQVLDVLVAAHAKGIIHRDLKPENLFVTAEGRLKMLDFGLARMLDDVPGSFKTRTGLALGTLPYMAPEQALGRREDIDGRVDLFALGATAFRILSRRKVHEANSEAELLIAMATKAAPPLASVAPSVPPEVCAIVDLALAFAKEARYPDARTMQEDVRAVLRGQKPAFAAARLSVREESTKDDRQAPLIIAPQAVQRTPTVAATPSPAAQPKPTASAGQSAADAFANTVPAASVPGVVQAVLQSQASRGDGSGAGPATSIAQPPAPKQRSPLVWLGVLAALALLVFGLVALAADGGDADAEAENATPTAPGAQEPSPQIEQPITATEATAGKPATAATSTTRRESVTAKAAPAERPIVAPEPPKGRDKERGKGKDTRKRDD
jgi:serine/threonine-protein kinase